MNRIIKIVLLLLLTILLMLIRHFEDSLFYDPLISFFKTDYSTHSIPSLDSFKLIANITLRFGLNTILSLAMLGLLFVDKGIVKLASILYTILFVILMICFSFLVFYSENNNYFSLFYVRRFLIQPLLLLILIPAFYFHRKKGSN